MRLTPTEVIQAAGMLSAALVGVGGLTPADTTFGGTTEYWFDGAGVHNRRHRLHVHLTGMRTQRGFVPVPVVVNSQIEVLVEVTFEPILRRIGGIVTAWSPRGDFRAARRRCRLHPGAAPAARRDAVDALRRAQDSGYQRRPTDRAAVGENHAQR